VELLGFVCKDVFLSFLLLETMKIHHFQIWGITVPSLKLTYPLKIDPWKRRFLLETIIFRRYVSFREGMFSFFQPITPNPSIIIGAIIDHLRMRAEKN